MSRARRGHRQIAQSLGQHFLVDQASIHTLLARVVCEPDACCIEIGAGDGALTHGLAQQVSQLIAVECDARYASRLRARCESMDHVSIAHGDILSFTPPPEIPLVVVGAIPYQLTSPILERLIAWRAQLRRAYLVLQWEVAQRLVARPGTKAWGRLTCFVQYYAEVQAHERLAARLFDPPPRVDSQAITLTTRRQPACEVVNETHFFGLIRQIFHTRRKTLWNSLRQWGQVSYDGEELRRRLVDLGLDPQVRGETLSLAQLADLSCKLLEH